MKDTDRESVFNYIFSICEILKRESSALMELIDYPDDAENISRKVAAFEEEADSVFHDIVFLFQEGNLARDPEATTLLELSRSVEDCTDAIDQLAMDFYRYNVTEVRDDIYSLILNISRAVSKLTDLMFSLKKMDKLQPPIKYIVELDAFKVEEEKNYDDNIHKLFTTESDPVEIIRWKSIYDSFRETFKAFENVADMSGRVVFFEKK